jgi:hypothetical protein
MLERALTAHPPHLQIENQRHQDSVQPLALGTGHGSGVWNAKLGIDRLENQKVLDGGLALSSSVVETRPHSPDLDEDPSLGLKPE